MSATVELLPPLEDPERWCTLCDELIEAEDWADRHSLGMLAAHPWCCVEAGCSSTESVVDGGQG